LQLTVLMLESCIDWRRPSAPAAPADGCRAGEVTGVGEPSHHHGVSRLDFARVDRAVEVDRNTNAEEVAALVEGVMVPLARQSEGLASLP
jgi:hypothetical protein